MFLELAVQVALELEAPAAAAVIMAVAAVHGKVALVVQTIQ